MYKRQIYDLSLLNYDNNIILENEEFANIRQQRNINKIVKLSKNNKNKPLFSKNSTGTITTTPIITTTPVSSTTAARTTTPVSSTTAARTTTPASSTTAYYTTTPVSSTTAYYTTTPVPAETTTYYTTTPASSTTAYYTTTPVPSETTAYYTTTPVPSETTTYYTTTPVPAETTTYYTTTPVPAETTAYYTTTPVPSETTTYYTTTPAETTAYYTTTPVPAETTTYYTTTPVPAETTMSVAEKAIYINTINTQIDIVSASLTIINTAKATIDTEMSNILTYASNIFTSTENERITNIETFYSKLITNLLAGSGILYNLSTSTTLPIDISSTTLEPILNSIDNVYNIATQVILLCAAAQSLKNSVLNIKTNYETAQSELTKAQTAFNLASQAADTASMTSIKIEDVRTSISNAAIYVPEMETSKNSAVSALSACFSNVVNATSRATYAAKMHNYSYMESVPKLLENVANKIKTLLDTYIVSSSATDGQKYIYLINANNSVINIVTLSTYISNIKDVSEKAKNATISGQSVAQSIAETGIIGEQSIVNNLLANVDDANDSFSYISNIQTNINTINTYITVKYQNAVTVYNTPAETTTAQTTTSSLFANGSLCTSSSECKSNFCYLTNKNGQRCDRGNLCATPKTGTKLLCSRKGIGTTINTELGTSCVSNTCSGYRAGTNSGL